MQLSVSDTWHVLASENLMSAEELYVHTVFMNSDHCVQVRSPLPRLPQSPFSNAPLFKPPFPNPLFHGLPVRVAERAGGAGGPAVLAVGELEGGGWEALHPRRLVRDESVGARGPRPAHRAADRGLLRAQVWWVAWERERERKVCCGWA
eukprot:1502363-Rhodomonas_salina.1